MADFYGVNYSNINVDVPSEAIPAGEVCGKKRILFDKFVCAQDVYAISDKIYLGAMIPKGARVLEAALISPSLGTTGIMQLGFAANGVDNADADAFIVAADAGGQAVKGLMPAGAAALGKKFEADTQMLINFTEASDDANGLEIKVWVEYILD